MGEFVILQGSFLTRRWWAVVAVLGVILAALYLLWAYQRVFHGEPEGDNATVSDLKFTEALVMAPLVGIIVFMGVYPKPFFDRIEPAVTRLVEHIEDNSDYREPKVATEGEEIVPESERRQEGEHGGEHAEGEPAEGGAESEGGH